MTRREALKHEFVEYVPDVPGEGVLYVSIPFRTATHRCCCGCGAEVVTPISPADWQVSYDGETVSLYPSVGNWSLPCRSHYWIRDGRVVWARAWSKREIARAHDRDRLAVERRFSAEKSDRTESDIVEPDESDRPERETFWQRMKKKFP